jgi:hypothetical protein
MRGKNKLSYIMDSDTSTVAETLDLDNTNNNGLCFYKTLEYTHRNKNITLIYIRL